MTQVGQDTLGTRSTLNVGGKDYAYYSLKKAAEMFGIPVRQPKTQAAFGAALRRALSGEGATLIEVFTSRKENAALHASLGAKIQRVVGRML